MVVSDFDFHIKENILYLLYFFLCGTVCLALEKTWWSPWLRQKLCPAAGGCKSGWPERHNAQVRTEC